MATILIVEDNDSLGHLYMSALAQVGASLARATSRQDALAYLERENAPDLVLLDMSLPDGNGLTILKHLNTHTKFKDTRVVMITGNESYYAYANTFRVDGYFYKPVDFGELIERIKDLLGKKEH